jgi:hypothetical protein
VRRAAALLLGVLMCGGTLLVDAHAGTAPQVRLEPLPAEDTIAVPLYLARAETTLPTSTTVAPVPEPPPFVYPTSPDQWFAPSGRNQGTQGLADALAKVALRDNALLYRSEEWGRTTGGANSDHHISRTDSWAIDLAVRGVQQPTVYTETAAQRISAALGVPNWTGGDLTRTVNGYRFQVLWKVDGHFNHVHIGVRKV